MGLLVRCKHISINICIIDFDNSNLCFILYIRAQLSKCWQQPGMKFFSFIQLSSLELNCAKQVIMFIILLMQEQRQYIKVNVELVTYFVSNSLTVLTLETLLQYRSLSQPADFLLQHSAISFPCRLPQRIDQQLHPVDFFVQYSATSLNCRLLCEEQSQSLTTLGVTFVFSTASCLYRLNCQSLV